MPRRRVALTLAITGLAGFSVGWVIFPEWQVAVETAQVVAGLVTYPPDNPFYTYHTKLWTLLHQASAVLLLAGVSERVVSLMLCGLMGMLSFQALAMVTLALSRSALIAIGTPFLVLVTSAADHGVVYPIWLMGTSHTYGAVGLSAAVLVMALIGAGCLRSGAFLLGLLPAIHPSIGAWTTLTIGLVVLWELYAARSDFRRGAAWWLAGAACTSLSLAIQWLFIVDVPEVDPLVAAAYVSGFTQFWDVHRAPVQLTAPGVAINLGAGVLAGLWLSRFGATLGPPARALLRMIVVAAIVGVGGILISHVPPDRIPSWLLALMPARFLNVNVFLFVPLLLGLAWAPFSSAGRVVATVVVVGLCLDPSRIVPAAEEATAWAAAWPVPQTRMMAIGAVLVGGLAFLSLSRNTAPPEPLWLRRVGLAGRVLTALTLAMAVAATWRITPRAGLIDRANSSFWAEAASDRSGLTATGGSLGLVQLLTRRPVLVNNGGLDGLAYAPESGPAMDTILRDVYGLDVLHPPPGTPPRLGAVPDGLNEVVWEGFTRERWREIRRRHGVSQLVTRGAYDLDLPVAAQAHGLRLYRIPE